MKRNYDKTTEQTHTEREKHKGKENIKIQKFHGVYLDDWH